MLALFRTNQLLTSVLLIFYLGALHLFAFIKPITFKGAHFGIGMEWVYHLTGTSGWVPNLFLIFLLSVNGFLLNVLASQHRLGKEVNLFPGLFYCLLSSAFPSFLALLPVHLANTFLILAVFEMLSIYKKPSCADRIFNIGFWVGIASLFYFSYSVFILLGLLSLSIFRAFKVRERLMIFIGGLTPYILVGTTFFLIDQFEFFVDYHFLKNIALPNLNSLKWQKNLPELIFFGVIFLVVLTSFGLYQSRKNIEAQKKVNLIYWGLLISALSLLFQPSLPIWQLLFTAPFLALFIALNFESFNNQTAEVLHLIIFLGILFFQYQAFIF